MADISRRLTFVPDDAAPYARAVRQFAGQPPSGKFSLDAICKAFRLQVFNMGRAPSFASKTQLYAVEGGFRLLAGPAVIYNPVRVCEEISFALGHALFYDRVSSVPARPDQASAEEDAFCVRFGRALFEGKPPLMLR